MSDPRNEPLLELILGVAVVNGWPQQAIDTVRELRAQRDEARRKVLDLPDAEHVHVTCHPDGTFTATPMVLGAVRGPYEWVLDEPMHTARRAWVDCPTAGDMQEPA